MWLVLKRLFLGFALLFLASAVLLIADWNRRITPASAAKPARMPRVALLQSSSRPLLEESMDGIREALAEKGFRDGETVTFRSFCPENDLPTANNIAKTIVNDGYDMVITASTPSLQTMANANTEGKVMHVFGAVTDPFSAVPTLDRNRPLAHPRHLVGYGSFQPVRELFTLMKKINPKIKRVGNAWCPAEFCSEACTRLARQVCKELDIELLEAHVENSSGVLEAAQSLAGRGAEAFWVGGDNVVETAFGSLSKAAKEAKIPVFSNSPTSIEQGAAVCLGANYHQLGHLTGELAAKILGGLDPATVPITNCMPEQLAINLRELKNLATPWNVPADVLATAQILFDENGNNVRSPARSSEPAKDNPPSATAPKKNVRVGVLYLTPDPGLEKSIEGMRDALKSLGYEEGRNLELILSHANGEMSQLPQMVQSFEAQRLDAVFVLTTPCLVAAMNGIQKTPVVYVCVTDALAAGAGKSATDHRANITGVSSPAPARRAAQLIKQLFPDIRVAGTLYNPGEVNARCSVNVFREALSKMDIRLEEIAIAASHETLQAVQALVQRGAQVLWEPDDNTVQQGMAGAIKAAQDSRVPLVACDVEWIKHGCLMGLGAGYYGPGWRGGEMLAQILEGRNPAQMPLEVLLSPTAGINFSEARKCNVKFPRALIDDCSLWAGFAAWKGRPAQVRVLTTPDRTAAESLRTGLQEGLSEAGLAIDQDVVLSTGTDASGADIVISANRDALRALPAGTAPVRCYLHAAPGETLSAAARRDAVQVARILAGGTVVAKDHVVDLSASRAAPNSTPPAPLAKRWTIHLLEQVDAPTIELSRKGVLEGLRENGLVEGRDYELKVCNAQGELSMLSSLVDGARDADLIYTITTPALQTVMQKVTDRPVIFCLALDPLLIGDKGTHEKHRPNVAGIYDRSPFEGLIALVKECLPQAKVIGIRYVPGEANSVNFKEELEKTARAAGLTVVAVPLNSGAEAAQVAQSLVDRRPDLICQLNDNLGEATFASIVPLAKRARIPIFAFSSGIVAQGACLALTNDHFDGGRESAAMAARVMRGESPANIPYRSVSRTRLVVNPASAREAGLTLPDAVLKRADQVVEH
jgi:ABC-type uncharacterized transport system substrate-binding protein